MKLSIKYLPHALRGMSKKKTFGVEVVPPGKGVTAWDTRWGGGTRCEFQTLRFEADWITRSRVSAEEGDGIPVLPGRPVVETGTFCGQDRGVRVYLRDTDLARFFGLDVPEGMPALIAADYAEERAEFLKPTAAKRVKALAALVREIAGGVVR